jgi:hypothetical protein
MERGASTSRSVESAIGRCHTASRCRSTSRRSDPKLPSFCVPSSSSEHCEAGVTASSTSRSRSRPTSKHGVFPFFDRFPLRTAKSKDLEIFREITELVQAGSHLTVAGVAAIPRAEGPDEPRWEATSQ